MAGYKDFVRHLFGIKQTVNVSPTSEHQFRQQLAYENAELKGDIDKLKVVLARVQGTKDKQKEEEEIK